MQLSDLNQEAIAFILCFLSRAQIATFGIQKIGVPYEKEDTAKGSC